MRVAALVAVAALAAVGASSAHAAKSPCALVTAADASHALGVTVKKPKLQNLGLFVSCFYATSSTKSVTVQTRTISRNDFDRSAKANPGPVKHLAGIGSDAYSVGGGSTLLVWKNGTGVTLLVLGMPNALTTEKALAAKAAARL
jgi:hypothetical protein